MYSIIIRFYFILYKGEEIAIGIRGFTHGYDFYAPRDSVVFHEYAEKSSRRKKIHMFWYATSSCLFVSLFVRRIEVNDANVSISLTRFDSYCRLTDS